MSDTDDRLVLRRKAQLRELIAADPILRDQVAEFLQPGIQWESDAEGVVIAEVAHGESVVRVLEMELRELRLGRKGFPERKRIPLGG